MEQGNVKRLLNDLKRCLNPSAYGSSSCRYHGTTPLHTRKNIKGEIHPPHINGFYTKEVKAERSAQSAMLQYLIDLGNHCNLFYKQL